MERPSLLSRHCGRWTRICRGGAALREGGGRGAPRNADSPCPARKGRRSLEACAGKVSEDSTHVPSTGNGSMDDAGNGLRGSRAVAMLELLAQLRERYRLGENGEAQDLGGSSCLTLLVTHGGSRSVARVYRPYVTVPRLEAIQQVRKALVHGGVPCTEIVRTCDGEPWGVIDGRLVELETFVEHDAKMDSWERLELGLP